MLEGWRRASAITAILGALGAAAVLPARSADGVKIGILWPLTGPEMANLPLAATAGLPGLGGAKLELVFADHQGNPSVAQQQALRLINEERVHVLFGAYHSSCSLTATAVAERYGIPFMVGESAALNITGRGFKWIFRGTPIASDYAATYMRFFDDMRKEGKKIDAIAVVNENTDYGTSVADEIEAAARKANIPVAMRIPYGANSADVSAQVLQLKERRPDVVIFISYTPDAILYIKTMKNLDYLPPMVIGDDTGFSDPSFITAIADIAQGAMNRSAWDRCTRSRPAAISTTPAHATCRASWRSRKRSTVPARRSRRRSGRRCRRPTSSPSS